MALFIAFVLLAVLLGAGSMLAPVWSADNPPNGLTSTLLLAIIIIGALLWMQFRQWDTLIIDYLVFGIVSAVVLGGTMVQIQDEDDEADSDQSETQQADTSYLNYVFWGIVTLCSAFTFLLAPSQNTAPDSILTDMQSMLSLQALTQDYSQLDQIGASGFYTIALYLAEQLRQPITDVYPAVMTAITLLIAVTTYDLGRLGGVKWGYVLAVVSVVIVFAVYWLTPIAYIYAFVGLFCISLLTYLIRLFLNYTHLELVGIAITLLMLAFLLLDIS